MLLAIAVALLAAGQVLRAQAGVELDAESLRAWVERQGWLAPFVLVLALTFRQFLLVPSQLLLVAGGLLFGGPVGAALGAVGFLGSALVLYGLAKGLAGEALRARLRRQLPILDRSADSLGPAVCFFTAAYPLGPMTGISFAAGLSSVPLVPYVLASATGGAVRSVTLSTFGATLSEVGSTPFWIATVIVVAVTVGPLLHPGLRRRVLPERAS